MKFSILICTTTTRASNFLPKIIRQLEHQASQFKDVEIIYLGDNKKRSVGKKRNDLINLAQGEYISFVDDDDSVSEDYTRSIMKEIEFKPDVIVFKAYRHVNGRKDKPVSYNKDFLKDENLPEIYRRIPNHLNVWRKELCLPFKEINFGEDAEWAIRMKPLIKTQRAIERTLYNYWFDTRTTETQKF